MSLDIQNIMRKVFSVTNDVMFTFTHLGQIIGLNIALKSFDLHCIFVELNSFPVGTQDQQTHAAHCLIVGLSLYFPLSGLLLRNMEAVCVSAL